ncbi:MAG: hypothetical protein ABI724_18145 [Betaproteobacteria bacterium]
MSSNVVFFAWNRSIPGREHVSAEHFQQFVGYLAGLQQKGAIASSEAVFLDSHGGDMNGFFLIRADNAKLDTLLASNEWLTHMTRCSLHLEGSGHVRGATGAMVAERMELWTKSIPS